MAIPCHLADLNFLMRYRIAVIAVLIGLVVSGCSSNDTEYQTKLAYYELCMTTEADTYRTRFASGSGVPNPSNGYAYTPFEYATVMCEQFKP